jgi:hypothetical protein
MMVEMITSKVTPTAKDGYSYLGVWLAGYGFFVLWMMMWAMSTSSAREDCFHDCMKQD